MMTPHWSPLLSENPRFIQRHGTYWQITMEKHTADEQKYGLDWNPSKISTRARNRYRRRSRCGDLITDHRCSDSETGRRIQTLIQKPDHSETGVLWCYSEATPGNI